MAHQRRRRGNSLQRTGLSEVGTLASSWNGAASTPGTISNPAAAPHVIAQQTDGGSLLRPDLIGRLAFTFDSDVSVDVGDLTVTNATLGGEISPFRGVRRKSTRSRFVLVSPQVAAEPEPWLAATAFDDK